MRKDERGQMGKKDREPQRKDEDMGEELKVKSSNYQE